MNVTMIGLDTAKSVFQVHGVDTTGRAQLKRKLRRDEVISFFEKQERCTVVLEACGAGHHWARVLTGLGHEAKLLAPEAAKPNWLQRQMEKSRAQGDVAADKAAPSKAVTAGHAPPPPDAPGPQGGILDFMEALKQKPEDAAAAATPVAATVAAAAAKPAPAKASKAAGNKAAAATPAVTPAASTPVMKLPALLSRRPKPKAPRERKAASRSKAKPPTPRRMAKPGRSWRPLLFKLLVGVGVASGAVAMQDKLPRMESRGAATTSSQQDIEPVLAGQFQGHGNGVTALAYSEDGRVIVTAGKDGTLKVWNASSSSLVRTIELDDGAAVSLALSGSRAVTGHADGAVVIWDFDKAEKIASFKRNDAEVWSVTFAGSPNRVAASSHDWKVTLWDAANPAQPVHVLDAHDNAAQAVAFFDSANGPMLATGGADKTVKLWNLDSMDQVRRYRGHRDFVTALAFSPNGRMLASAGLDGSIRLWSTGGRGFYRTLNGHKGKVASLAFAPSGDRLVSAGEDGLVRIWDVRRGKTARTLTGNGGGVMAAQFSPDGQRIASAGADGIVRLWNSQAAVR